MRKSAGPPSAFQSQTTLSLIRQSLTRHACHHCDRDPINAYYFFELYFRVNIIIIYMRIIF